MNDFISNFEVINSDTLEQKLTKIDLAVKYLEFVNDPNVILNCKESSKALDYLIYLFQNENTSEIFDSMSSLIQFSLINILIDLIKLELSKSNLDNSFRLTQANDFDLVNIEIRKDQKLTSTLELLSKNSDKFCIRLHEISKIKDLFYMIFTVQINETNENQIKSIVLSLINLSRFSFDYPLLWNDCEKYFSKLASKDTFNWLIFLLYENLKMTYADETFKSNLEFELSTDESKEMKLRKINLGYKYLLYLNIPEVIIISEQSMNIMYYISELAICECSYDEIDSNLKLDIIALIIKLMKHLHDETVVNVKINCEQFSKNSERIIRRNLVFIEKLAQIIQDYSNVSLCFCSDFSKSKDGIQCLFNYIQSEYLSDYLIENLTKKVSSFILKRCYDSVIGSLQNLSHIVNKFYKTWEECDGVQSCIKFTDKMGVICIKYRSYVYMILANIASDYEINTLSEIRVALNLIADYIHGCARELDENSSPIRIKIELEEDSEKEEIIFTKVKDEINFHLVELLSALYHLAVNDNVKKVIYEKCSMRKSLKTIILKGNEVEKEFALQLLYQLCFDHDIAQKMAKNKDTIELVDYLRNLINDTKVGRKNIIKYCKGIFWMINNDKNIKHNLTIVEKHLMISYNRDSRDLCLSIKSALEKIGYKIWIDVEDIHGSSLESMANAIEKSACVLMCMTEKYKMSSNCRLEAEYSVTLNKPIIPLILQKDYKPDGWLGIILGSKMFINFMKYDFEECIRRLRNELSNIFNNDKKNSKFNIINKEEKEEVTTNLVENKLAWSETEVNEWLNCKNFKSSIMQYLNPCNGKQLYQMSLMVQNAPEFFYSTLRTEIDDLNLKDLALFAYELSNLFKN